MIEIDLTRQEISILIEALQHTRDRSLRYEQMEALLIRLEAAQIEIGERTNEDL